MSNKLFLGIVGDDFTGSSDAASFAVKSGLKTMLFDGIPSDIAKEIAYETVQSIARWKDEAQSAGISEAQIKMMQPAFTERFDCI